MLLPVSLATAAGAGLVNAWLGVRCSAVRVAEQVDMGDGGNPRLIARMRAQANFVEYTPFVLILLALVELARGADARWPTWLAVTGAAYLAARVAHALGMDRPAPNPLRLAGIGVTMAVLIGLSVTALTIVASS